LTASSADCTVATQEPQVMPVIVSVTVSSFAGEDRPVAERSRSTATTNPVIKWIVLSCIRLTSHSNLFGFPNE
jgi:hypothetical protein